MNTKALVVIFAALALSYVLTAVAQDYRGFGDQYVVQVGDFVLQHTASGGFAVVSNLTAAQKAAVASWPVATGVKALVHDYNSDGFMDVLVGKVSSAIPGAQDVFVFAPHDLVPDFRTV